MARSIGDLGRSLGSHLSGFAFDLIRPADPVLSPYVQVAPPVRRKVNALIGLLLLAAFGAIYGYLLAILPPVFLMPLIAPLGVLALLVIWVLPDQGIAPVKTMTRLLFAFMVVAIIWPNYLAIALPGLPWISFRRLTSFPMALALLIGLSASSAFREDMRRYMASFPLLSKMLLAFLCVQVISVAFASDPGDAVNNLINYMATWATVFFVCLVAFQDRKRAIAFLKIMLACSAIVAGIGIAESFNQRVLWADHIPSFLKISDADLALYVTPNFRNGLFRVKSTLTNPLPYAELMAAATLISAFLILRTQSLALRIFLLLLDVFLIYAMQQSQSRLGLIGVLTGHALIAILLAVRHWLSNKLSVLGPALTLGVPAVVGVMGLAIMTVSSLNNSVLGGKATANSNAAREVQWSKTPGVLIHSPVFGFGPRQGAIELTANIPGFKTIDSYYLSIVLDYGLVGVILFYGMFIAAMWKMTRVSIYEPGEASDLAMFVVATLGAFLVVKGVSSQEDNHWYFFALFALAVTLANRERGRGAPS